MDELMERYPGQYLALVDGEIASSGDSEFEAYKKVEYVSFRGKFLPLVPIELKGSEWVEFLAYLDSGASYTIFHSDVLKVLNLEPMKERKEFFL